MLIDNDYCFGCGQANPIGLKLTFEHNEATGEYSTTFVPEQEHQGWLDRVHGGLLALVFDEVLSRVALISIGKYWVTAELNIRLIRPAPIGVPLRFTAKIVSQRTKLVTTQAQARDDAGNIIGTGTAKLMKPGS
jgi:uncharacterized protein (TIGR00369 family)